MTEPVRPKRMGVSMIPVDALVAHPLNANVLPEDLREKLAAHIRSSGRYPHLIVRPHPWQQPRALSKAAARF